MATRFTGGCLCGAVRYECSADPFFMGNCHCRDCQRSSGGAYEPDIGLPAAALTAISHQGKKSSTESIEAQHSTDEDDALQQTMHVRIGGVRYSILRAAI